MRVHEIVGGLCALVSVALLLIVLSQNQVLVHLNNGQDKLPMELKRVDDELSKTLTFKTSLGELLHEAEKIEKDLKTTVAELVSGVERMKPKKDACQAEKKMKTDELAVMTKQLTETQENLKSEYDAWKEEIIKLQTQLAAQSPVCDHVMNNTYKEKMCDTKA